MTFKTENQMNTRATTLPIEECYMVRDRTNSGENNANVGYSFDYPMRWINDPSLNKAIGIRRLECIPRGYTIDVKINIYPDFEKDDSNYISRVMQINVLETNTLHEIMTKLCDEFTEYVTKTDNDGTSTVTKNYQMHYSYENSQLKIWFTEYANPANPHLYFELIDTAIFNLSRFMEFLNQENPTEAAEYYGNRHLTELTLDNVWDREKIMFHASFSNSKHEFIGFNGDFYQKISLLYNFPASNVGTFWIRFTTDGQSAILPYYAHIIIQLTFIVNSSKSLIL